MKLLLDENLPKKFRFDLFPHETWHVADKKWQGKKNGELLRAMLSDGFVALITIDKNLQFQQNFSIYPIPVLVLDAPDNTYPTISQFSNAVLEFLKVEPIPNGPTTISL